MTRQQNPGTSSARRASPAVLRRRRIVVSIGLLIVIALIIWGISGIAALFKGSAANDAGALASASASATAAPTPSASTQPSATPTTPSCDTALVKVSAATDKPVYAASDTEVKLSLKVTNEGSVECPVNVGTSQMEFLISSGQDRIFSSKDCAADTSDLTKTIKPGGSETAVFSWQRNRSVEGCQPVKAAPGGGGATYVFQGVLGAKTSPKAIFTLQ